MQKEISVQFDLGDYFGDYEDLMNYTVIVLLLQLCYSGVAQLKSADELKVS